MNKSNISFFSIKAKRIPLSLVVMLLTSNFSLLTTSCDNKNTPTKTTINNKIEGIIENKVTQVKPNNNIKEIHGSISFPLTRKEQVFKTKKFKTKATVTDIAPSATISFIVPENNSVVATGLSDENGVFSISLNAVNGQFFSPEVNKVYILEASKRVGSSGNNTMTIRTFVRWNGGSWDSITEPDLRINEFTTAVTIIQGYNPSITPESTIAKINVNGSTFTPSALGNIPATTVTTVSTLVNNVLAQAKDPVANVKLKPDNVTFFVDNSASNIQSLVQSNGCSSCDFTDINISNTSLAGKDLSYANLQNQDLSNKDLSGTILIGADLTNATLPADLSYLNLSETNLTNQDFANKNLTGANFSNANLTNTKFISMDLTKSRFSGANFTNADLTSANMKKVYLFETNFTGTKIGGTDFTSADMTGVDLSNVLDKNFAGTKFDKTILIGSAFKNMNLNNIDVTTATIEGSDFTGSTLTNKALNSNLKNCNFTDATIDGGSLDTTTPTAFFKDADLSSCDFTRTKIKNINFDNTNFSDSNFTETDLNKISFYNSNLNSCLFDKSVFVTSLILKNTTLRKASFSTITNTLSVNVDSPDISYISLKNAILTNWNFYPVKADYFNATDSEFRNFKQKMLFNYVDTIQNQIKTYTIPKYSMPNLALLLLSDLKAQPTGFLGTTLLQYPPDTNMKNDEEMINFNGITDFNTIYTDPNDSNLNTLPPDNVITGLSLKNTSVWNNNLSIDIGINGYFYKAKFENLKSTNTPFALNLNSSKINGYCNDCTISSTSDTIYLTGTFLSSIINSTNINIKNSYLRKSIITSTNGVIGNSFLNQTNYTISNNSGTNFFTTDSNNDATCSTNPVLTYNYDYEKYSTNLFSCIPTNTGTITSTTTYKNLSRCFKNFNTSNFRGLWDRFPKKILRMTDNTLDCTSANNDPENRVIKFK